MKKNPKRIDKTTYTIVKIGIFRLGIFVTTEQVNALLI